MANISIYQGISFQAFMILVHGAHGYTPKILISLWINPMVIGYCQILGNGKYVFSHKCKSLMTSDFSRNKENSMTYSLTFPIKFQLSLGYTMFQMIISMSLKIRNKYITKRYLHIQDIINTQPICDQISITRPTLIFLTDTSSFPNFSKLFRIQYVIAYMCEGSQFLKYHDA